MNIFTYELKANFKSALIWAISLIALAVFFLVLYPSFSGDVSQLNDVLAAYPPELVKALGISDLTTFSGFYSYVILYVILCGAIQAMNLGLNILSKETRLKTADFLLSKPVSRTQVVSAKLAASMVLLLVTQICYLVVVTIASMAIAGSDFNFVPFILVSCSLIFVQFIFFAMGFLLATILPKIRSVISLSLGVVFTFFALEMLQSVLDKDWLRYFIPFKYFDPQYIVANNSYDMMYVVLSIAIVIVSLATSYVIYNRRDVHAV